MKFSRGGAKVLPRLELVTHLLYTTCLEMKPHSSKHTVIDYQPKNFILKYSTRLRFYLTSH